MTSPILNRLPPITEIISLIPPGANPYKFGLGLVESSAFPSVDPRTYTILIILSIIHACTIVFCGAVIAIPYWRKRERGKKMVWLLKKFYVSESRKIYWIPNTSLAVAICQLLTSCFCEIYTYVDYASLKSPEFAGRMSLGVCVQFMWLFSFYSYFVTSWGALNTCLCSPHPSAVLNKRLISRPIFLYFVCTLIPVLVTIITLTWSIVLAVAYHHEIHHITYVRDLLTTASNRWETKATATPNEFLKIVFAGDALLKATNRLITCLKWNSFTWAMLWSFTGLFYTYSVWPLIKLMRSCSKRMTHIEILRADSKPNLHGHPFTTFSDRPLSQNTQGFGKVLRRGYIFLVCHCTVMTISVIYTIAVCIVIGTHTEKVIVMAQWRSLGSWLYLVSGGFSAAAMLFQSWRSYTETDFDFPQSTDSPAQSTTTDLFSRISVKLGRTSSMARTNSLSSSITYPQPVAKALRWSDDILIIKNPVNELKTNPPEQDLEILRTEEDMTGSDRSCSLKDVSLLLPKSLDRSPTLLL
ncbi:hypothetical protein CROQUDRAFT_665963 [Cronartium quercuum f. sp. fusiforme G11]|uniref:Uncharacterized protein n=1 Tax=Cronartium quercuum f. sp. fusiforme G11 TaxID=708437 RepID=A0A9P6T5R5_9BASI|nr:hypothetical protein CROQUDRAFT_665963 [Cronartium quercuum f. sp. fusiforme G11]